MKGRSDTMCRPCKNLAFTLMLSAGLLVWLSALFGVGSILLY